MALRALVKADAAKRAVDQSSVKQLYRSMIKEIPRVMAIYDVDLPVKNARSAVAFQFRKNKNIEDSKIISILLAKGYMELEETLMQWKQKTHLLRVFESPEYLDSLKPKEERRTAKNKYVFHEIYTDADEETDDIYWEDIPAGNHVSGAPKFDKESTAWYPGISNRNMLKNPPPELSE